MKLVLREYLAMLRESGELDVILPDLVLAMGFDLLTRPTSGSRQIGVDLPAVGIDPDDRAAGRKLFLFAIKRGNITRTDWNSGLQSVRPSLDEILDSYLLRLIPAEFAALPKKIILATGGDMRQDVLSDWRDYAAANRSRYPQYGPIEFGFWGGDKLSQLLDEHLFDEFLFPESARQQLRKTIAVADESDEEPKHFYALVADTLFRRDLPTVQTPAAAKARRKALFLIELSLLVVFRWSEEAGNLRAAYLSAERTLLTTWEWISRSGLVGDAATRTSFARLSQAYRRILLLFANKLRVHARAEDGLMIADDIENSLRVFEVIGLLGVLTCSFAFEAANPMPPDDADSLASAAVDVASILADVISNNPAAYLPRYDQHAIDIGIGLMALGAAGPAKAASTWLERLAQRVMVGIQTGRHFPVATDSYEDLLALRGSNPPARDKLLDLSTLLPTLADWMAVLDMPEAYARFRDAITSTIPQTNLQLWFPDATTEVHLYSANAGYQSGATLSSLELPEQLGDVHDRMRRLAEASNMSSELSCLREGWSVGAMLASRHFRTPLIPFLWQDAVAHRDKEEEPPLAKD